MKPILECFKIEFGFQDWEPGAITEFRKYCETGMKPSALRKIIWESKKNA